MGSTILGYGEAQILREFAQVTYNRAEKMIMLKQGGKATTLQVKTLAATLRSSLHTAVTKGEIQKWVKVRLEDENNTSVFVRVEDLKRARDLLNVEAPKESPIKHRDSLAQSFRNFVTKDRSKSLSSLTSKHTSPVEKIAKSLFKGTLVAPKKVYTDFTFYTEFMGFFSDMLTAEIKEKRFLTTEGLFRTTSNEGVNKVLTDYEEKRRILFPEKVSKTQCLASVFKKMIHNMSDELSTSLYDSFNKLFEGVDIKNGSSPDERAKIDKNRENLPKNHQLFFFSLELLLRETYRYSWAHLNEKMAVPEKVRIMLTAIVPLKLPLGRGRTIQEQMAASGHIVEDFREKLALLVQDSLNYTTADVRSFKPAKD